jgi:hypothetical protein
MNNKPALSLSLAAALALASGAAPAWARSATAAATTTTSAFTNGLRDPARAFIKMDLQFEKGTHGVSVGQSVPVIIRAFFLGGTGVTLNGRPTIASDALLLSDLTTDAKQSSVQIRGLPYTALTWNGILTAVKEGTAKTEIELPVQLSYREAPRARALPRPGASDPSAPAGDDDDQSAADPFASLLRQSPFASDPFFAQMFKGGDPFQGMFDDLAGTIRQRDVTLRDNAGTLTVAALPLHAPPGFSGAVGSFTISATLDNQALRVGEPATLTFIARGRGSFSRLSPAGLAPSDELNTYGVTSTFKPGATALTGEKVFTQTIVPRQGGALTVPAVALTYFDPTERRFVTRHSAPIAVAVRGSAGDHPAAIASTAPPTVEPAGTLKTPSLVVTAAVPDGAPSSLTPVIQTRWFWKLAAAMAIAAAALSVAGFAHGKGAFKTAGANRRVRRQVAAQGRRMKAAVDRGDAVALFTAARTAWQTRLGAAWGVPSQAIAAADVATRLGGRGDRICEVFERADRLTYAGGQSAGPDDLEHWQSQISDELGAWEATS